MIIGTIFLAVCMFRAMKGHFTQEQHVGFEAAAWYWHFVDVVWLFLFACVGALLIAAADPARAGPDIDGGDRASRWPGGELAWAAAAGLALAFLPVLGVVVVLWRWSLGPGRVVYALARMLLQLVVVEEPERFVPADELVESQVRGRI